MKKSITVWSRSWILLTSLLLLCAIPSAASAEEWIPGKDFWRLTDRNLDSECCKAVGGFVLWASTTDSTGASYWLGICRFFGDTEEEALSRMAAYKQCAKQNQSQIFD